MQHGLGSRGVGAPNFDLICVQLDSAATIRVPLDFPEFPVTFDLYFGGLIALALGIYLLYALFHPEKF
jgi:K+-transporting ATPase KdpF subunit